MRLIVAADGLLNGYRFPSSNAPCAVGAQFGICVSASANMPPRLDRLDLDSGRRTTLFDPNTVLPQARRTVDSDLLAWPDSDGRQFTGPLFLLSSRRPDDRLHLI